MWQRESRFLFGSFAEESAFHRSIPVPCFQTLQYSEYSEYLYSTTCIVLDCHMHLFYCATYQLLGTVQYAMIHSLLYLLLSTSTP